MDKLRKALESVPWEALLASSEEVVLEEGASWPPESANQETVSSALLVVEDPIFVEPWPGEPPDPTDYVLLHEYWPRLLRLFAAGADTFGIDCWTWDEVGLLAAQSVGGQIVGRAGETVQLTGSVTDDWVSRVEKVCWGAGGELPWMNVNLYHNHKLAMYSSHHGGELMLYLPPSGAITEDVVRSLLPAGVTLTTSVR